MATESRWFKWLSLHYRGKMISIFVFLSKPQGHVMHKLKPQCTSVFSERGCGPRINLPDHSQSPGVSSIWAQFLWAAPGMNWNSTPEQSSRGQSLQETLLFIHPNSAAAPLQRAQGALCMSVEVACTLIALLAQHRWNVLGVFYISISTIIK